MNESKKKLKNNIPDPKISVLELKTLLILITETANTVYFRYRLLGQMWQPNFLRVIKVTDNGVFLEDEINRRIISVTDLKMIVQFELDGSLHHFDPNFHYDVVPN